MATPQTLTPWPPNWLRTLAFVTGLGLGIFEGVVEQSEHLALYGFAFLLTGLPIARGLEGLIGGIFGRRE